MESYYSCRKQASSGRRYRRGEAAALDLAARANALVGQHYLVLSDYLADVVRARAPRKPVSLVRTYGVDTAVFRPPVECRRVIRERRGLPTGGAIIFFSSRVAPEKDAETLLEAFAQLRHQGRDLWLLHRSGGYREFLRLAEQYAVTDRVIATDAVHPVTELPLDYQCSDLCVQASRAEGLGFSPLEALACGTPVVAASVGGLKETIIEGCTGWTYPPGDAATLARQIEAALSDPAEARRRTAAGRALVVDRFERTLVFDQLERIILAGKDAPLRSMKQGGSA